MDFSLIERAKLTQKEFGDLCGVSRVTVCLWATDKMKPHRYIRDRIGAVLDAVNAAVEAKQLPLPPDTPRDKRYAAIEQIIRLEPVSQPS